MKLFRAIGDSFKNKQTRPRAIIWLGTVATAFMLVAAVGITLTTSYWFCATICHYPQFDAVSSYNNSTHTAVACIACHKQPGGDPVSFLIFKVEALFTELPSTLTRSSDMPINPLSTIAMNPTMIPDLHCTQCHRLENRGGRNERGEPNTSQGIIMNHWAHIDHHITCAACHNRVGHNELEGGWKPHGYPTTDGHSPLHDDYMKMTACYRCHRFAKHDGQIVTTPYPLELFPKASGECSTCHAEYFNLVPDNHLQARFVEDVHGPLYVEIAQAVQKYIDADDENFPTYNDLSTYDQDNLSVRALNGVPNVRAINYCYTCHTKDSCGGCHGGIIMPHPEGYRLQAHLDDSAAHPDSCAHCHQASAVNNTERAGGGETCSACHHSGRYTGVEFDPSLSWEWEQHAQVAGQTGSEACLDCHSVNHCGTCHVNLR